MKIFSKTVPIIILISFFVLPAFAQNLVPNGNFEQHRTFDGSGLHIGSMGYVSNWHTINQYPATYCNRYFVKKFGQERLKKEGYINFDTLNLFDGNAMIKLEYGENCPFPYADRDSGCASYIKTKLISPLELGEIYEVSMWVYTKINPATDPVLYNHIGMYLSRHELFWKSEIRIPTDYFFFSNIIPGQWTEIKWYIRALCSLEYLTIGAFRDDAFPSLFRGDPANNTPYYVDRVAIKKVNEDSLSTEIHPTPYCEFYEKAEKEQVLESISSMNVRFESNASDLDANDKMELDSFYQANLLRKHKIFLVMGHTDSQAAENVSLSEARAESVKSYLIEKYHVPEMSLMTFGLGSAHPIADNSSTSGRQQNRRVTIRTSDLVISQLLYRKGLDELKEDNPKQAYVWFDRWLRSMPIKQRIEIVGDSRLKKLKESIYWTSLINSIKEGYSIYPEPMNAYYLDSLFVEDQAFRVSNHWSFGGVIEEIDTTVLPEGMISEDVILRKDDSNFAAVQKYLDRHEYPEISKVGRRPARGLGYVVLHHGDSITYLKAIPILKDLCIKGEAEWDIFAKMSDKLSFLKNEPQEYGTQYQISPQGVYSLYRIDNIDAVNKRRAGIGMPPTAIPEN